MKNYIRIILSALLLIWATPSKAEMSYGVGLIIGQVDSDGTETEGTAADTVLTAAAMGVTAPSEVDESQLKELNIFIKKK